MTLGGIALALLAIALATAEAAQDRTAAGGLLLGISSGICFGLCYIALDATPPESGLCPSWQPGSYPRLPSARWRWPVASRAARCGPAPV